MPSIADVLRNHIDYTAWASRRMVEAAAQLTSEELLRDFQTADRSVLGTLVHVFAADRLWLARLQGLPYPPYVTEVDYRLSVLENDWPALHQRWREWACEITDEQALAPVAYSDLQGRPFSRPLWQLVLHVVNHGTHHRGQAADFLRTLGHTPPPLDMTFYYREMESAAGRSTGAPA